MVATILALRRILPLITGSAIAATWISPQIDPLVWPRLARFLAEISGRSRWRALRPC